MRAADHRAVRAAVLAAHVPDFEVSNHGSLFLLQPMTPAAHAWLEYSVDSGATWWAGALVVEHRYIADIVSGAQRDGLVVA